MKLKLLILLMFPMFAFAQIIPQFRDAGSGNMRYIWTGKSPAGYDTLWNAQTIRGYVNVNFKFKSDSVNNSGYVTHGYFNAHAGYTFLNGLNNDGSNHIGLGGDLNQSILIDFHSNPFQFKSEGSLVGSTINELSQFQYSAINGWYQWSYAISPDHSTIYNRATINVGPSELFIGMESNPDIHQQGLYFRVTTPDYATSRPILLHDDLRKGITVDWRNDANLSDSSYVPKRYADSLASLSPPTTASRGITKHINDFRLGGAIIDSTVTLQADGANGFNILQYDNSSSPTQVGGLTTSYVFGTGVTTSITNFDFASGSNYGATSGGGIVKMGGGSSTNGNKEFEISESGGIKITDSRTSPKGIEYALNYNGTLGANSLAPKRYVDSVAAGAGTGVFAVLSGGNSFTGAQYLNTATVMTTPDSIAFLGDSYTAGYGVQAYQKMSTIASGKLNAIEVNLGVGGSTVEEQSPTMPFGVSSYVARKATIPVYNSHYLALVINGSINDPTLNSANYNVTNYTADLGTNIVDYAVSVRGWPAGKILLVSQPYKSPTSYVSRNGNPAATDAINISFANATKAVATAKGTRYLDQYNLLKNNGGKLLEQADSLHLNPSGHRIVGNAIANSVGLIIKQNGQQLAVNGLTQFSKIRLSSTDTLQSKGHTIIVADSLGNIVYAPNKYISNVSDTTAANAQGANLNVNGVVRGSNLIANQTVKALGSLLTGSYLNSASAGTYPTNKLGLYLLGSAARGFIDSYSTTSANTGNQLDIQSQSLGDVNIYGNINFKSTGKLTTLSSPLILNTYLQIPNATGVYPGTKTGGLITANITAMYIDAFSSSGGVGLPLFLNNQSTQSVQSYGSFSVMNAKAFNVGTGVSTFGGPVFVTPFTSAGVVTNNGSAQLVSSPSLSVILGGSGQTSYTNGQLLIGNTTGNTLTKATLTASAATGLLIANGLGSITISNDTTVLLTAANTFPKNDTRYQKISTAFTNPMSTLGDIIYGGASGVATRLAGNTTTTQKFLTSTGNGTISATPAYFDLFGGNNTWGGNNTLNGALNLNGGANFKGGIASAFYNTANTFSINLGVNTVTANRNITLPDASGALLLNTSGSFSGTGTATTTFTVTIGATQANTIYKVNVTPTSLVAAAVFYVNNKTTTTFDVVYVTGLTGAVSFDWALFK